MGTLAHLWDATRMRLLIEIERHGTVSGAAHALGIGQPSASQHLRLLEAAAGQPLVERNGRGSRLTEAGQVLAAHAAHALAALDAGEQALAALAGLQVGTIRIGASTVPGEYLLPDTLGCFRRDFPGVRVEVEIAATETILGRLLSGRVQLALVGRDEADPRVVLEPFLDDEIVGVTRPRSLPLDDGLLEPDVIAQHLLLCREPGSSSRQTVEKYLAEAGLKPAQTWELGSTEAVKRAAREGLGVAFLSRYAVADDVARGELETFRLRGLPPIERRFCVARLEGRARSPAERAFVQTLTRCCAKNAAYAEACVGVSPSSTPISR